MRIKLIQPRLNLRPVDSELKRLMAPPLGLLTLSVATPDGNPVEIEDENVRPIDFGDLPGLAGITATVENSVRAYEISREYRRRGVATVLGGIHPSLVPEEALLNADSVCVGDGAAVWGEIVADAASGRLKKIYSRRPSSRSYEAPVPSRDLIDRTRYLYTNIMTATRGCPHACEFCYNSGMHGARVHRKRTLEEIRKEIESLGTGHVMFVDDNLAGDPGWCRGLMPLLREMNVRWNAAVSADIGDHPDLLDLMAGSGCMSLFIGFETVNQDSLDSVGKRQNRVSKYAATVRDLHSRGIMVNASIVFGFDCDGKGVFDDTVGWLVENRASSMTAHILTPYPGTRLFKRLEEQGRILTRDWSRYNTADVVYRPAGMSPEELMEGYLRSYGEFYSFKNIMKRIPLKRELVPPFMLFNLGYRKFGRATAALGRLLGMNAIGAAGRRIAYGIN
ncbi:MAG: B12-binding domain-containing radical SAM protein [Spirochaetes bacterium]|jgi:radical SAM superfamily enzyme YgiQ (UPF0313 family)|nr:B12-binding domain-containing radical SAM protein [Spirochaetota bacterium]